MISIFTLLESSKDNHIYASVMPDLVLLDTKFVLGQMLPNKIRNYNDLND